MPTRPKRAITVPGAKMGFPVRVRLTPQDQDAAQREAKPGESAVRREAGGVSYGVPVQPAAPTPRRVDRAVIARPSYDVTHAAAPRVPRAPMGAADRAAAGDGLFEPRATGLPPVNPAAPGLPFGPITGEMRKAPAAPLAPTAPAVPQTAVAAAAPVNPVARSRTVSPAPRAVVAAAAKVGATTPELDGMKPGQVYATNTVSGAEIRTDDAARTMADVRQSDARGQAVAGQDRERRVRENLRAVMAPAQREYEERTSPEATNATLARMRGNWSASAPRPGREERLQRLMNEGQAEQARIGNEGQAEAARIQEGGRAVVARIDADAQTAVPRIQGETAVAIEGRRADVTTGEGAATRAFEAAQAELDRAFRAGESTKMAEAELERARIGMEQAQAQSAAESGEKALDRQSAERVAELRGGERLPYNPGVVERGMQGAQATAEALAPVVEGALKKLRSGWGGRGPVRLDTERVKTFAGAVGIRPDDATVLLARLPNAAPEDLALIVAVMQANGLSAEDAIVWAEQQSAQR